MKKQNNLLIYKLAIVVLIIIAIVTGTKIFKKQYDDQVYEKENIDIVEEFKEQVKNRTIITDDSEESNESETSSFEEYGETGSNSRKKNVQYQGYNVIGLIRIPIIDLEYPILEKTTKATMRTSISRFDGGEINGYGNVSLAGHNNYSGTMFGKNHKLKVGDIILLTGLDGTTISYSIYNIFVTGPNDTSVLETKDETIREVTLITCKNGRSERLIIKAKEKID